GVDDLEEPTQPDVEPSAEEPVVTMQPPVLGTVKEPVFGTPSQSPGQTPGQTPYQGGVGSDEPLRIIDLNYIGEGCPSESVATNVSDDQQAFTILFSEFYVEFLGEKGQSAEKNC